MGTWQRKEREWQVGRMVEKHILSNVSCNRRMKDTAPLTTWPGSWWQQEVQRKATRKRKGGVGCLIPLFLLHEMLLDGKQTQDPPPPSLIIKKIWKISFYSEKWLQRWCLGSKHYPSNYTYLPFITMSKLLTYRALLCQSWMQPEISEQSSIYFPCWVQTKLSLLDLQKNTIFNMQGELYWFSELE